MIHIRKDTTTASLRCRHGERGAVLAEFAFAAALALSVMFGILDFGRAMYDYDLVANAARLGSRYAIVNGAATAYSTTAVQTYVRPKLAGIDATQVSLTTVWPTATYCHTAPYRTGCNVTVVATYNFAFTAFPIAPITMTSTSEMPISQ
jgi:Flp pilus assembly protein TadG